MVAVTFPPVGSIRSSRPDDRTQSSTPSVIMAMGPWVGSVTSAVAEIGLGPGGVIEGLGLGLGLGEAVGSGGAGDPRPMMLEARMTMARMAATRIHRVTCAESRRGPIVIF